MHTPLWTVYIDGSALPNPGRMRIGGVAYAPDGTVSQFSQAVGHSGCNNEAEALAAIHALQWLHSQHATQVLLYTDNSILAEQMSQAQPKRIERLFDVYEKAREVARLFTDVRVQWIPRHKNTVADALARGDSPVHAVVLPRREGGRLQVRQPL